MNESFKIKMRWQVYNKQLKEIRHFRYSCFDFKFSIKEQKLQEKFVEVILRDKVMPWNICDFFILNNIKYSLRFKYCNNLTIKDNSKLLKTVLILNKTKLKVRIHNWKNKYKILHKANKKVINNKKRRNFVFQLINLDTKVMYFIQCDSNIWWKPKKIVEEFDNGHVFSIGWLFCQIGKAKYKKQLKK